MEIKRITQEKSFEIIETRRPLGLFWLKEKSKYVAIDNTDGEAWTEEFDTMSDCFKYLKGDN